MTDRINSLTVVLRPNMREDDAKTIMDAIRLLKGVIDVKKGEVNNITSHIAHARVRAELGVKINELLDQDTWLKEE